MIFEGKRIPGEGGSVCERGHWTSSAQLAVQRISSRRARILGAHRGGRKLRGEEAQLREVARTTHCERFPVAGPHAFFIIVCSSGGISCSAAAAAAATSAAVHDSHGSPEDSSPCRARTRSKSRSELDYALHRRQTLTDDASGRRV